MHLCCHGNITIPLNALVCHTEYWCLVCCLPAPTRSTVSCIDHFICLNCIHAAQWILVAKETKHTHRSIWISGTLVNICHVEMGWYLSCIDPLWRIIFECVYRYCRLSIHASIYWCIIVYRSIKCFLWWMKVSKWHYCRRKILVQYGDNFESIPE